MVSTFFLLVAVSQRPPIFTPGGPRTTILLEFYLSFVFLSAVNVSSFSLPSSMTCVMIAKSTPPRRVAVTASMTWSIKTHHKLPTEARSVILAFFLGCASANRAPEVPRLPNDVAVMILGLLTARDLLAHVGLEPPTVREKVVVDKNMCDDDDRSDQEGDDEGDGEDDQFCFGLFD